MDEAAVDSCLDIPQQLFYVVEQPEEGISLTS